MFQSSCAPYSPQREAKTSKRPLACAHHGAETGPATAAGSSAGPTASWFRRLAPTEAGLGRFALGLGLDLLELAALHGRQRRAGRPLVGIGEGATVALNSLADRPEELLFPVRQLDAAALSGALGSSQRPQRPPLGRLAGGLIGVGGWLGFQIRSLRWPRGRGPGSPLPLGAWPGPACGCARPCAGS